MQQGSPLIRKTSDQKPPQESQPIAQNQPTQSLLQAQPQQQNASIQAITNLLQTQPQILVSNNQGQSQQQAQPQLIKQSEIQKKSSRIIRAPQRVIKPLEPEEFDMSEFKKNDKQNVQIVKEDVEEEDLNVNEEDYFKPDPLDSNLSIEKLLENGRKIIYEQNFKVPDSVIDKGFKYYNQLIQLIYDQKNPTVNHIGIALDVIKQMLQIYTDNNREKTLLKVVYRNRVSKSLYDEAISLGQKGINLFQRLKQQDKNKERMAFLHYFCRIVVDPQSIGWNQKFKNEALSDEILMTYINLISPEFNKEAEKFMLNRQYELAFMFFQNQILSSNVSQVDEQYAHLCCVNIIVNFFKKNYDSQTKAAHHLEQAMLVKKSAESENDKEKSKIENLLKYRKFESVNLYSIIIEQDLLGDAQYIDTDIFHNICDEQYKEKQLFIDEYYYLTTAQIYSGNYYEQNLFECQYYLNYEYAQNCCQEILDLLKIKKEKRDQQKEPEDPQQKKNFQLNKKQEEMEDKWIERETYFIKGYSYSNLNEKTNEDYKEAIDAYSKALELSLQLDEKVQIKHEFKQDGLKQRIIRQETGQKLVKEILFLVNYSQARNFKDADEAYGIKLSQRMLEINKEMGREKITNFKKIYETFELSYKLISNNPIIQERQHEAYELRFSIVNNKKKTAEQKTKLKYLKGEIQKFHERQNKLETNKLENNNMFLKYHERYLKSIFEVVETAATVLDKDITNIYSALEEEEKPDFIFKLYPLVGNTVPIDFKDPKKFLKSDFMREKAQNVQNFFKNSLQMKKICQEISFRVNAVNANEMYDSDMIQLRANQFYHKMDFFCQCSKVAKKCDKILNKNKQNKAQLTHIEILATRNAYLLMQFVSNGEIYKKDQQYLKCNQKYDELKRIAGEIGFSKEDKELNFEGNHPDYEIGETVMCAVEDNQLYCKIFAVHDFKWDNKIINHSGLFKYCVQKVGLEGVLQHGTIISEDLVRDAAEGDYELAVAGLISLGII